MKLSKRDKYLRQTYGLTEAQYVYMEKVHKGKCWICKRLPKRRLNVDHDHKSEIVRGLLCFRCNKYLIGRHHDAILLREATLYMDSGIDWRKAKVD